jgi:hypothetical protein
MGQLIETIPTTIADAVAACPAIRNSNLFQTRKTKKKPAAVIKIAKKGSNVPACVRHPRTHCTQSIRLPPESANAADDCSTERIHETVDHVFRYLRPELLLGAGRSIEVPHP